MGQSGAAELSLNHFDFQQIAMFLPQETQLKGQADVSLTAQWAAQLLRLKRKCHSA
ncbi:hypothetical protein [Vibrio sp. J502]|uniref:hypothetical protein n=1 Tax=Vibrio sp. J502 TaxID=2978741 RepID=UPI0021BE635E|nr:hypothetical protein [Vibrio sp. J502]UXH28411.1 hypothetical protein N5E84_00440 [Vibrio sp. J502]